MSFRRDARPPVQDMPPPGGFPAVDIFAKARARGPTGFQLWAFSSLAIAYGLYRVGQGNRIRTGEKLEERQSRYAMAAALQAEEDLAYMERERVRLQQEAEIMKDVPDWEVGKSPYYSNRWVPRNNIAPMDVNWKK